MTKSLKVTEDLVDLRKLLIPEKLLWEILNVDEDENVFKGPDISSLSDIPVPVIWTKFRVDLWNLNIWELSKSSIYWITTPNRFTWERKLALMNEPAFIKVIFLMFALEILKWIAYEMTIKFELYERLMFSRSKLSILLVDPFE